jgi:hypothetical protein
VTRFDAHDSAFPHACQHGLFGCGPQYISPIIHAASAHRCRYTHRVAISNHRLLAFDGERVTFRWRDYAHGNQSRVMTLDAVEFLRRFFLHILPKGFVRIRHFGFLANCFRTQRLSLCRQLLNAVPPEPAPLAPSESFSTWHCPRCGALLIILTRLTPRELSFRCTPFDSS